MLYQYPECKLLHNCVYGVTKLWRFGIVPNFRRMSSVSNELPGAYSNLKFNYIVMFTQKLGYHDGSV